MDHPDGTAFHGPNDPGRHAGPDDPIAGNPKDVDALSGAVQSAQASRRSDRGIAAARVRPPEIGGGMGPHRQPPQSSMDMLRSVLRFKRTLLAVFVVTSVPMIFAIWTQIIPQYQARAEIRVRPIIPRLVFKTEENGAIPFYDSFVNTQVSLVRSLTVLQRVLDREEVQKTQWYEGTPPSLIRRLRGDTAPPMERLRDSLSVRPRPRTEIIDVSFTDASAKDARLIVDTVLQQYLNYIARASDDTEGNLYNQLVEQYKSLENEIQHRERLCADLCKTMGTETPQELISSRRVRLDQTQASLDELRNQIALLEWELEQIPVRDSNAVAGSPGTTTEGRPPYYADAEWRKLDLDVRTLEQQIASSVYLPTHQEGMRLMNNLNFARDLLLRRQRQLDEQWSQRLLAGGILTEAGSLAGLNGAGTVVPVEHQLAKAKQERQLVERDLEKQGEEFKPLFESAQLLEKESSILRNKRELFDEVRRRLEQKNIERNVPGSIEVLTWAFAPSQPAQDRRVVFTVMALCAGFGLGGVVAFLRANRNQAIYTPRDMPQPIQVAFLGHIPYVRSSESSGEAWCDAIAADSYVSESIRVMRTMLFSRLNGRPGVTILISSAMPGTGKSSFTVTLGRSMALAGKKVLLIDADFYKMTLSKWFALTGRRGFIDALSAKTMEPEQLCATRTPGLSIMPAGKQGSAPIVVEEIANGAFQTCMSRLVNHYNYDVILLDSPPMLPVADAVILANQVDGTIMVEREHLSQRTNVTNALLRLNSTGGSLLGTVFVGSGDHESHGYSHGYGYDYR